MVLSGIIRIEPFIKTMPMSRIMEAYEGAHRGDLMQRIVLIPDFNNQMRNILKEHNPSAFRCFRNFQ
jgi:hypothetical protein